MSTNINVRVTKFDKMFEKGMVVVGFNVTTENGKSLFIDTTVTIPSTRTGVTDSQLIDAAWVELNPTIQAWVQQNATTWSPVGMDYVPPI